MERQGKITVIPDEAVEAAAAGMAGAAYGLWELVPEPRRRLYLRDARLALEAAAPHMLADIAAELEDAPPANYEEDNYDAGYAAGLAFALDSLGGAK